uniref:F-box/kelch-repeat protein At3g23880 family n=2 Tax=Cajanus cajan TaxID=3821 RepID=A0A151S4X4_CAJCA|nr:F-box/kelch-repeat protein At3g23880 family [Cajanus cajan]
MTETTTKVPKILSSATDESPPLPVLPDELIQEILLRVPVKFLLQFRCVSKSWKTLISNPQFVKEHLDGTSSDLTHQRLLSPMVTDPFKMTSCCVESLFQDPSTPAESTCFMMSDEFSILGTCHGLLCLFNIRLRSIQLWNPAIRIASKSFLTRLSNPREYVTHRGFGYDHVNHKYKLFLTLNDQKTVTKVYTFGANSNSKSWKVIQNFPCCPTKSQGHFVTGTGTLNWFAKAKNDERSVIVSFDLVTESYGEVLLPAGESDIVCIPELVILRNCLCVSFFDSKNWVLWQMKEYGVQDSWTKLMTVPHFVQGVCTWDKLTMSPHYEHDPLRWFHSIIPLCISEDGVILIKTAFSKLVLYDPNVGRWDFPVIRGHHWHNIQTYHESLVSPLG